jgi:hypothetical protein
LNQDGVTNGHDDEENMLMSGEDHDEDEDG